MAEDGEKYIGISGEMHNLSVHSLHPHYGEPGGVKFDVYEESPTRRFPHNKERRITTVFFKGEEANRIPTHLRPRTKVNVTGMLEPAPKGNRKNVNRRPGYVDATQVTIKSANDQRRRFSRGS